MLLHQALREIPYVRADGILHRYLAYLDHAHPCGNHQVDKRLIVNDGHIGSIGRCVVLDSIFVWLAIALAIHARRH
jgi:hypothetical protein